jgi:hypothetical protein
MSNDKLNADKLSELWDNGFENDNLDPGDIFDKTINYCYELERKITALESARDSEGKEVKSAEEIVKKWRERDTSIPHWMTVKHAIKAAEEYAQSKQKEPEKEQHPEDQSLHIRGEWLVEDEFDEPEKPRDEDQIKQKCHQCGNDYYKELHCRECGNNFPFYIEDNLNLTLSNSYVTDGQLETEARRMITENPMLSYNLDFALKLARFVRDQLSKPKVCSNCNKVHDYSEDICYVKIGSKT